MPEATLSADKSAEIEKILTEVGIEADKLQKLVETGVVIPRPSKLDDLPEDLKAQVQNLVVAESQKEIKTAKDQLYATLEKHKQSNEELRKAIEAQNSKIKAEEEAKTKAALEEQQKNMTLEQRMEQMRLENQRQLEETQKNANEQIRQLQQSLRKTTLSSLREKLILSAGSEIIPELVINPELFPTATEQDIIQSAEMAKAKYAEIQRQVEEKRAVAERAMTSAAQEVSSQQSPTDGQQVSLVERLFGTTARGSATLPSYTRSAPVAPTGNAHLGQKRAEITPDSVKTMSKDQLAAARNALLDKYGL